MALKPGYVVLNMGDMNGIELKLKCDAGLDGILKSIVMWQCHSLY